MPFFRGQNVTFGELKMNKKLSDEEIIKKIWGEYEKGERVGVIAKTLGVTRKTVSKHISKCPNLEYINKVRKAISKEKRKEYKRQQKKAAAFDAAYLKRQHEIDVRVLSSERFFY